MTESMQRARTLSGWQRLFVLASLLWLGVCAYITYLAFPTKALLEGAILMERLETMRQLEREKKELEATCPSQTDSDREFLRSMECRRKVRETAEYQNIREREKRAAEVSYEKKKALEADLLSMQLLAIGEVLPIWLIPSVFVYLGVAWVHAGFKRLT